MSRSPAVAARGVSKLFGQHEVLRDFNLEVGEGEVVVICGPSGSGKSTFLRCVNRLEDFQKGQLRVNGVALDQGCPDVNAFRREIGFVFQQFHLFPHLTVRQNITLAPGKLRGVSPTEGDALAEVDVAR